MIWAVFVISWIIIGYFTIYKEITTKDEDRYPPYYMGDE